MIKKIVGAIAVGLLCGVNANAADTDILVDGEVTGATGAFATLVPVGTPIAGLIRVDVLRGVTVGPGNITSITVTVGIQCFTTDPPMCPSGAAVVPITSIDGANFSVDVGSDTGTLAFTAFSPTFNVSIPITVDLDTNTVLADGGALGTASGAIALIVDSDGDGDPDITDADDDNDRIGDAYDLLPVIPSNDCTTNDGINATLVGTTISSMQTTCAAKESVDVSGTTNVGIDGDLLLISEKVSLTDTSVTDNGRMEVINADPCPGCSVCGNGILEAPEQCDDGNTVDGDGCSAICLIE